MSDLATIGYAADLTGINKLNKGLNTISATSTAANKAISRSSAGIKSSMGQVGIQVQQLSDQIQGGQSPFLALSQQAADIGIVLGAPLIGVLASFAATFAGMVLPSLLDTTDATKDLASAQDKLKEVLSQTDSGVFTLTNSIKQLAEVNKTAAKIKLAAGIADASASIKSASSLITGAIEDFEGFTFATKDVARELANLDKIASRGGVSPAQLIDSVSGTYQGAILEIANLGDYVDDLGDKFGTTTEQSIALARGITGFDGSVKSANKLAATLGDIGEQTGYTGDEFAKFAKKMLTSISAMDDGDASLVVLKKALEDLPNTLDSKSADVISSLQANIKLLSVEVDNGSRAAMIYAAQMQAGVDPTSKLGATVAELAGKLFDQRAQLSGSNKTIDLYQKMAPISKRPS